MDKKNKIILASVLTTVPIVSIASTIATITVLNNKKTIDNTEKFDVSSILDNNNNSNNNSNNDSNTSSSSILYMFNGKIYKDFNEIIKRYMDDYDPIRINKYIGDFTKAFNYSDKSLNMNWLREFDVNKILPAYKTASGLITEDFDKAKSSFLNKGLTKIYYTDFNGNLFEEKSEAQQAMAKSKVSTPIMFYELNDGTKINPLNKTDINYLKEKAYESIYDYLWLNDDSANNSNMSISLYDSFNDNDKNKILSSKYSNSFYNKNSIVENLIKEIFSSIYIAQREYLVNNLTFDVKVEVMNINRDSKKRLYYNRPNDNGEWWFINEFRFTDNNNQYPKPIPDVTPRLTLEEAENKYSENKYKNQFISFIKDVEENPFTAISSRKNAFSTVIGKNCGFAGVYKKDINRRDSITFPDVKFGELTQFDAFLDYEKLVNSNHFGYEKAVLKSSDNAAINEEVVEIFRINNFRGASFNLFLSVDEEFSTSGNTWWGVDYKPFVFGSGDDYFAVKTTKSTATFDVILKKSKNSKASIDEMFNYVQQKLNEKFMIEENEYSLISKVSSLIKTLIQNNPKLFWNDIYNIFTDPNWVNKYTNGNSSLGLNSIENNPKQLFQIDNTLNINAKNRFWFDTSVENKFMEFSENSDINNINMFDGITFNYDNLASETIDETSINDILDTNKLKLVIEFNHNPLFMIDLDISLVDKNKEYLNGISFKSFIRNKFFKTEKPTSEDLEKIVNVSQDFNSRAYDSKSDLKPANSANYFHSINLSSNRIEKLSDGTWKFNYKSNDIFSDSRYPELPDYITDTDAMDKINNVRINQIVNVYNEIIKSSPTNMKDLADPKDIVFLFGKFDGLRSSPLTLKFRKFLAYGIGEIPSLSSGKKLELYDNTQDLEWAILNKTSVEPGKVVMLFDNDGNIVNPGVAITDEEELWLTSDGAFASKKVLYENFLRTKIIRPIEDKVFYKTSEASEPELVVNQINKVYSFTVPDLNSSFGATITYYYLSYEDCFNNLVGYLRQMTKEIIVEN
ncbi:MAG: hypothetical protein K2K73_01670 [Ureaplasma sp.]|nr:hypothetical protein [Ureaplasma sp.]